MGDWISIHTLIAFLLGVVLSAMVKGTFAQVKGKVTG